MGSIPPPTSTPSGLVSRMSARSGRELQLAGHHPALGLVAASAGPGDHGCGLSCQRPPEPASSAAPGVGPCDTGHVIRTAQATGLFDLSPSPAPSREIPERSTAGTLQVSKRPADTATAN